MTNINGLTTIFSVMILIGCNDVQDQSHDQTSNTLPTNVQRLCQETGFSPEKLNKVVQFIGTDSYSMITKAQSISKSFDSKNEHIQVHDILNMQGAIYGDTMLALHSTSIDLNSKQQFREYIYELVYEYQLYLQTQVSDPEGSNIVLEILKKARKEDPELDLFLEQKAKGIK